MQCSSICSVGTLHSKVDIWKLEQNNYLQCIMSFAIDSFKVEEVAEVLCSKGIN